MVEVRKPKPVHSWGDLISEIGTIVLGVLIALAAEQGVQMLSWRHQVSEARQAMRNELTDSAGSAYAYRVIFKCNARSLEDLRAQLLKSGPAWKGRPVGYDALFWSWDSSVWSTALASGTLTHMPPGEMNAFASAYAFLPRFVERDAAGQDDAAELGLLGRDLSLADGMRGRMLAAVGRAERRNWSSALLAKQFLERAATVGALPSDADRKQMDGFVGQPGDHCWTQSKTG
ncbi:hypothetical protein [Phenylobacterium sp.]|uniref:hypothetical protein n=1 Tax=Phenylobacterium sp. TaxID=1871053 RepID=UPI002CDD0266|nr:hypothetical protein [Phenylobacterium sp.]HLZ75593.1 hypothetical protein [Phenylobacterium sp.]